MGHAFGGIPQVATRARRRLMQRTGALLWREQRSPYSNPLAVSYDSGEFGTGMEMELG